MNAEAPRQRRALRALLGGLADVPADVEISDLTQDSRAVRPGALFLACRGRRHHGVQYAAAAVAAGARAILWEPAPGVSAPLVEASIVVLAVPGLSAQLGLIADRFFDAPSASLTVAGITGTNGKTTCAWLLSQALNLIGRRATYIGTLGAGVPGAAGLDAALAGIAGPAGLTTPDAVQLQRLLGSLRARGFTTVALEVSSHALEQDRVAGMRFHTALFTNLTRDHLDYHGDMDAYGAAKARLFDWASLVVRVINVDDPFGRALAQRCLTGAVRARLVLTSRVATLWQPEGTDYVHARALESQGSGLTLQIDSSFGAARLSSPLIGEFNADNLLSVLAVLLSWDVPLEAACAALGRCAGPPGRMQPLGGGALPLVLVDYAHTPDALAKALAAARRHCRARLYCVFGCGGERDAGKREPMGRIAALGADEIVITDDNPRHEDPERIAQAILRGVAGSDAAARA
ncbi:MAG TPA: UDP-N-acetylmuramoyl-L-alanyl-D-glutamate--2,6-diaminopimelate ligase, partial [Steroidobacteraceae bacterium]|nr:UDP-N-acetylmuramoyl-L-alanyl-D-glutamate--2,6-diaminopimelate ligase [Steroidobacteraceae bacterium]